MNRWRFANACLVVFTQGLSDSAPGALIPYMEAYYGIGYAVVSLIFVTQAIGFIGAAPFTHVIQAKLGRAKTLVLANTLIVIGSVVIVSTPPFWLICVSYFISGFGVAINLAMNNTFCANLTNSTTTLGIFHGAYGIGGVIGPLVATALVAHSSVWSRFYTITLAISIINVLFAFWAFRHYEKDLPSPLLSALERVASSRNHPTPTGTSSTNPTTPTLATSPARSSTLRDSLRNRTTLLGAIFIFAYQGAEVSISGWILSFLLAYRTGVVTVPGTLAPNLGQNSSIGYVTAGFWAGITLGRFFLSHPCASLGQRPSVFLLTALSAIFIVLVWQIPHLITEAVAVAIVGLLLGPIYPCATVVFSRLLGRRLQMSSLSVISAVGSAGGAVAPFVTGAVAQGWGAWVLFPVCLGLFGGMAGCWWGLETEQGLGLKKKQKGGM
jgi:fucose permease